MTQLRTNEKWYQNYPTLLDMSPHAVQWENKVILNKMFVFQYLKTVKVQGTVVLSKFNGIITDLPEISRVGGGVINFRTLEKRES
jgi:hypothetical protein